MTHTTLSADDGTFHQVIAQLIEIHDSKNYMTDMLKLISGANNWPFAELWQQDDKNAYMHCRYTWTIDTLRYRGIQQFSSLCKFAKGVGFIGKSWAQKQVITCPDIEYQKDFLRADVAIQTGLHAVVCIPVIYKNEVRSVLCFLMPVLGHIDVVFADTLFKNGTILGSIIQSKIL